MRDHRSYPYYVLSIVTVYVLEKLIDHEQTFMYTQRLWNIEWRMEKDKDVILTYYSHISRLVNTSIALTMSVTIGWLALLYICLQNVALKSSVLGFIVGFTLTLLFCLAFLALFSFNFLLSLMEQDFGIKNYINSLAFPTWMDWFGQRRKKLLYLSVFELFALSILIGFYLISSLFVFGLWLFISLLILFTIIIVGSIANLKKIIKEKPEVFSKFKK